MTHKFKSRDERRRDWFKICDELNKEQERANLKKARIKNKIITYLAFCLIMFFAVSFIVHSFHWVSGEGWLFCSARLGYLFVIFGDEVKKVKRIFTTKQ
jgi:hypothetical protein